MSAQHHSQYIQDREAVVNLGRDFWDIYGKEEEDEPSCEPQSDCLVKAKFITNILAIKYPEGVSAPNLDLISIARKGEFRYDRDFLLQFMMICKEKPPMLPPLDAIGLEPNDQLTMARGGPGRYRQGFGAAPRQGSFGVGLSPVTFNSKGATNPSSMSNFGMAPASNLRWQDRLAALRGRAVSIGGSASMRYVNQITPVGQQGGHGGGYNHHKQQEQMNPVSTLRITSEYCEGKAVEVDLDSPDMVDRKVKGLLNKLTMEEFDFDFISDQIISWANQSEKEEDCHTLIHVIRLIYEQSTNDERWSEMYARLCRKMMEQMSPKVQDGSITNNEGKPIAGGQLFRKHLLNKCQEGFERRWVANEKAAEDGTIKASGKDEENVRRFDEYYAAQKARCQGLALIKFLGELFKLQVLTDRVIYGCIKNILDSVDKSEEEKIESLCKLLTTAGKNFETFRMRAHLDVYFARMKDLIRSQHVSARMQYSLQDLIELRERKWSTREEVAAEKAFLYVQASMPRGGSRWGGDRGDLSRVGLDGWLVAGSSWSVPRPSPKAGDLLNFRMNNKNQPMTFGPSSVFADKKVADSKREALSLANSNLNISMLGSQAAEAPKAAAAKTGEPVQRRRVVLQPRFKPVENETAENDAHAEGSEAGGSEAGGSEPQAPADMTEADAKKKIVEDSKEFFAIRNLKQAEVYFGRLPRVHHHLLVETLVTKAVESKEVDAKLVSDFFDRTAAKDACSPAAFEAGFTNIAELIDDIVIDAPKALQLFAMMIKGAGLDEKRRTNLASKSMDSEKLLELTAQYSSAAESAQREHLVAQPHLKAAEDETIMAEQEASKSSSSSSSLYVDGSDDHGLNNEASLIQTCGAQLFEETDGFSVSQDFREGERYFASKPVSQHHMLVELLVGKAVKSNEANAKLVANFFAHIIAENKCSTTAFMAGMMRVVESIEDIAIHFPEAIPVFATIVKAANLKEEQRMELAVHLQDYDTFLDLTRPPIPRKKRNDLELVSGFLDRLVRTGMCTTALLHGSKESVISDIVDDIHTRAPEALVKLALMIKGEGFVA